jgi:hypothetical protein
MHESKTLIRIISLTYRSHQPVAFRMRVTGRAK